MFTRDRRKAFMRVAALIRVGGFGHWIVAKAELALYMCQQTLVEA
jgi:hypothetical protein